MDERKKRDDEGSEGIETKPAADDDDSEGHAIRRFANDDGASEGIETKPAADDDDSEGHAARR